MSSDSIKGVNRSLKWWILRGMGEKIAIQHAFIFIGRQNDKLCTYHHGELSNYGAFSSGL